MPVEKTKEEIAAEEQKDQGGVSAEQFKELVDTFKETAVSMAEANRPVEPAGPSEAEIAATAKEATEAAAKEYNEAREKANTLAAEGKAAEGTELMFAAYQKMIAAGQAAQPVKEDKAGKALAKSTKRLVKQANADVFKEYGDEIEGIMAAKSLESQLDPDEWERAIGTVKTAHFDDLMEAEREKLRKEFTDSLSPGSTLVAGGGRGAGGSDEGDGLTADQIAFADNAGFPREWYANAVKKYKENLVAGKPGQVAILNEDPNKRPEPGKF